MPRRLAIWLGASLLAMPVLVALTSVEAHAAMALRIAVEPSSPLVGKLARVTVLTLAPFSEHCVYDARPDIWPWSDLYPKGQLSFELKAFAGGHAIPVPLRQRDSDPVYWDGEIVFPEAGAWTLRMVRPEWSGGKPEGETCAGARIFVPVRPSAALPDTSVADANTAASNDARGERPSEAMCFDIVVDPDPPRVGQTAAVTVRTQWKAGVGDLDLRV